MIMAIALRSLALAALAVAFAGATPALRAFNGAFGHRYDLVTDRQAALAKGAEPRIMEGKGAEALRRDEAEINLSLQASQLQFLYTYYIWMEICAERFTQFDGTKAGLREVLKSKESGFPSERANNIWNATAEKFQQLESVLQTGGDAQLYADCDQNNRYVEELLTLASRIGGRSEPILRRKDF
jgi:hypothetical protein